jgi:uncharacterized LabA/DUF88 family protein
MDTIANFIDGAHLYKTLRHYHAPRFDFARLASEMANRKAAAATFYYDCPGWRGLSGTECSVWAEKQDRFLTALSHIPNFQVRLGKLSPQTCCECGHAVYRQKQVDTQIAVDLVVLAVKGQITRASLFAGDSDFIPAVYAAQAHGCRVHLFHGPRTSADLIDACDAVTAVSAGFFSRLVARNPGNALASIN